MNDRILMGHGAGGRLTQELVRDVFCRGLGDAGPLSMDDGAVLSPIGGRLVFTTDSYVVTPLEFPGGDIGSLAVCGTVNDLAVMGARPLWLSLGVILEEGFELRRLERLVASIAEKAREAEVRIVCGDTKVVEKGKGDGLFLNTAGIGVMEHTLDSGRIREGDRILVNGTLGDHGMALMTQRRGFSVSSGLQSDCAPLNGMIRELLEKVEVRWMRDATRGGAATVLNELTAGCDWGVCIDEEKLPVSEAVAGVSELLGLDPLYSANEGKVICVVPAEEVEKALQVMKKNAYGLHSADIGMVSGRFPGKTVLRTALGTLRTLVMPASDPLPRIC